MKRRTIGKRPRRKQLKPQRVRIGDTGAIQEGKAAAMMGGAFNPYRRYLQRHPQMKDDEYGRMIELRNAWDSGFASVPNNQRGTVL